MSDQGELGSLSARMQSIIELATDGIQKCDAEGPAHVFDGIRALAEHAKQVLDDELDGKS